MAVAPAIEWWTTQALAEAGLPEIPATRRGVEMLVQRMGWRGHPTLCRKRAGRGGGWEYHWTLLPSRAQQVLVRRVMAPEDQAPAPRSRDEVWAYFDSLPERARKEAHQRLEIIQQVEALEAAMGRDLAVRTVSDQTRPAPRTIWGWLALVAGIDPSDRLAYLAPRHRAAARPQVQTTDYGPFMDLLKADYMRLEAPAFAASFDVASRIAKAKKLAVPGERTARRRIEQIPRTTRVLAREGVEGLLRCFPPQIRDKSELVAMEAVNADAHKFDVFVRWSPDEAPSRPQMIAFQDLYSGKILAWQVDRAPNKVAVMSAFGEMVDKYGIPRTITVDNGHEFANKWATGGEVHRKRFKMRDDDPIGIWPQLGIRTSFTRVARGQSKPIERAFGTMASRIAKDPRFAGAYVGHKPDAKPENYMSRAVDIETFIEVLADGIEQHNARPGRMSDVCAGRSFDETFAESYASAPIRKATAAQRRLWLMGQDVAKSHARHGRIRLNKALYWSEWMNEFAGQKLVCRFDPEALNDGLEIYSLTGEYLGFAETQEKTPYYNLASARAAAALESRRKRKERELLALSRPLDVSHVAAELEALDRGEIAQPDAKIVELVQRSQGRLIDRPVPQPEPAADDSARHEALVVKFAQQDAAREARADDTDVARWHRAMAIEERIAAGGVVGSAEAQWLYGYQNTPEYRRQKRMVERLGPQAIG